jgi:SAM-dependent methyltransferase
LKGINQGSQPKWLGGKYVAILRAGLLGRILSRRGTMSTVTEDDVVWAYRTFLGREPENETVVKNGAAAGLDWRSLVISFLSSSEYRNNAVSALSPIFNSLHNVLDIEVQVEESALAELMAHISKVWSRYGVVDPYWSVLTNAKYRKSSISDVDIAEFHATGALTVDFFEENCRQSGVTCNPEWSICDFGCGLGRVGEHFARRYGTYCGIDISANHLAQAQSYFADITASGIRLGRSKFLLLEEFLTDSSIQYDVFFSFIVLQHNPPPLIHHLLSVCLSRVRSGGLAFFQVPNYIHGYRFSVADYLAGNGRSEEMEMHPLPQPYVFKLLALHGFEVLKVLPHGSIGPAGLSLVYLARRV